MIAGRGPAPYLVLLQIQRLPDTALTPALMAGTRELFGWGRDRHLLADIYDATNQTTRAAGNWGKSGPPKIAPWPRPKGKAAPAEKKPGPKSVRELYRRMTGGG